MRWKLVIWLLSSVTLGAIGAVVFSLDANTVAFAPLVTGSCWWVAHEVNKARPAYARLLAAFVAVPAVFVGAAVCEVDSVELRKIKTVVSTLTHGNVKVVNYVTLTNHLLLDYDTCEVTFDYDPNRAGMPVVPGTARNRSRNPACQAPKFGTSQAFQEAMTLRFVLQWQR